MNAGAYISSGMLETYCLGLATMQEKAEVEKAAGSDPLVRQEIDKIHAALETYALANPAPVSTHSKNKFLLTIYREQSGVGKKYPPLITEAMTGREFSQWVIPERVKDPIELFDNLFINELPSTDAVTNFMVWARQGHEVEIHHDYLEYIVILDGHCDMYFNGVRKHYEPGEIIRIPINIPHYAVITSEKPMKAIVQRVMLAA